VFATEINFDHPLVALNFVHSAFAKDGPLMKHGDFPGNLPDKSHVVLVDNDAMTAGTTTLTNAVN